MFVFKKKIQIDILVFIFNVSVKKTCNLDKDVM